jgi:hypothetical protein
MKRHPSRRSDRHRSTSTCLIRAFHAPLPAPAGRYALAGNRTSPGQKPAIPRPPLCGCPRGLRCSLREHQGMSITHTHPTTPSQGVDVPIMLHTESMSQQVMSPPQVWPAPTHNAAGWASAGLSSGEGLVSMSTDLDMSTDSPSAMLQSGEELVMESGEIGTSLDSRAGALESDQDLVASLDLIRISFTTSWTSSAPSGTDPSIPIIRPVLSLQPASTPVAKKKAARIGLRA